MHRDTVIHRSQLHADHLLWLCRLAPVISRADMLVLLSLPVKAVLNNLTLALSPLDPGGRLLEVLVHYFFLLKVSDLADTIILQPLLLLLPFHVIYLLIS